MKRKKIRDVEGAVARSIIQVIGVEKSKIVPDADLHDDLGFGSLDLIEVEMCLEEDLRIKINYPSDIDLWNVRDLVTLVKGIAAHTPFERIKASLSKKTLPPDPLAVIAAEKEVAQQLKNELLAEEARLRACLLKIRALEEEYHHRRRQKRKSKRRRRETSMAAH